MFNKLALFAWLLPLALSAANSTVPDVTVSGQVITVCSACTATNPWNVSSGTKVYSFTGPATLTLSSSSGNSITYFYVDLTSGALDAGTTATVTANQIIVTPQTAFPANALPIAKWTNTLGAWDASGLTYFYPSAGATVLTAGPNVTVTANTDGSSTIASTSGSGGGSTPIATTSSVGTVQPDGSTITITPAGVISATAGAVPQASNTTYGTVETDGTTTVVAGGKLTVPTANITTLGLVQPDNSSITINNGVISSTPVPLATNTSFGVCRPDGTTITAASGVLSAVTQTVPTATTSANGISRPDGTTISINGSGVLTATPAFATTSAPGIVQPDNTSLTVNSGIISYVTPNVTTVKGFASNVVDKSTNYTFGPTDRVIVASGTSTTLTYTLPPSPAAGKEFWIKNWNQYAITLQGNGVNIDGSSSTTIAAGSSLRVIYDPNFGTVGEWWKF